jgi:hypothetical protein
MEQGRQLIPKSIFVETNWVVDVVAPAHLQSPQAAELLKKYSSVRWICP